MKTGWLARVVLLIAGAGLLFWFRQPIGDLLAAAGDQTAVSARLAQFGPVGPLLLGLILVLQVIVAAIPGHILMISGGYVYGFWMAFCLSLVSTVGGSQLAFLLARWAGRPLVERLAPADLLAKWNRLSADRGLVFFLFSFMLPIFPADVMNYVAGLSSLSSGRFFIANLLGRLPGLILMSVVGAYGIRLSPHLWLIILAVAAPLTFVAWRYGLPRLRSVVSREE